MSKQNKYYSFRAYPTADQQILIGKTFGCCRFLWNQMLADRIAEYKKSGTSLHNTPAPYKKTFSFLKEVDSIALANVQLNLNTAYNNFFRKPEIGFPKWKCKHKGKRSYTTNKVGNNIQLFDGYIKLPKLGYLKIRQHRPVPDSWKLKSVTLKQAKSGKYFVSILFEYEKDIQPVNPGKAIGLDYAMHGDWVDSNGNMPNYPGYYRIAEERLAREQRKLSRMRKGSSNWCEQKKRVAKISEHAANQRKDFLNKQSTLITNEYDVVGVEDINLQGMSQSLNFGKSVSDNGFGMFRNMLKYKLADRGKYFVVVDKFFPSSQICHECGAVWKGTKDLSVREWTCPVCGHHHNRDENAALNIRDEAMRLVNLAFSELSKEKAAPVLATA